LDGLRLTIDAGGYGSRLKAGTTRGGSFARNDG
jgi:hypothetical protein